jgi:RNA polymerase sigma-70 factor (ECF subfamily)
VSGAFEPVRRNCVLHAYVDGLSHSEIALWVGAPLGTVKAWIKRSLRNLRDCLQ